MGNNKINHKQNFALFLVLVDIISEQPMACFSSASVYLTLFDLFL